MTDDLEPGRDADPSPDEPHDEPAGEASRRERRRLLGTGSEPARSASGRSIAAVVAVAAVLVLLAVASLVHLPYVVFSPGPAVNVLGTIEREGATVQVIEVPEDKSYPTTGSLDMTTVRVRGGPGYSVNVFDLVWAWFSPDRAVYPVDQVYPSDATAEQVAEEGQAEMRDSQDDAAAVAQRALGLTVPEKVTIAAVADDSPAKDVLEAGDVIVSVAGKDIASSQDLRTAVEAVTPGDPVTLGITRGGTAMTVTAPTRKSSDGRTVLGVYLQVTPVLPVPVTFNAGDIGGPSAGLMFALSVYDKLSPGSLTNGRSIAGTGTISAEGDVGAIGGIQQKLVGARDSGATWFLAPADNCSEVVGHVPSGLDVVKVSTFDDALQAVEAIAAGTTSGLPSCGT